MENQKKHRIFTVSIINHIQNISVMQLSEFIPTIIKNGGGSLSLVNGRNNPTTGYMVALPNAERVIPIQDDITADINSYVTHYRSGLEGRDSFLGTWVNEGKIYLDISQRFEDKFEAMVQGIMCNQLAIWDCANGCEITLPTGQKSGTHRQCLSYAKAKVRGMLGE